MGIDSQSSADVIAGGISLPETLKLQSLSPLIPELNPQANSPRCFPFEPMTCSGVTG